MLVIIMTFSMSICAFASTETDTMYTYGDYTFENVNLVESYKPLKEQGYKYIILQLLPGSYVFWASKEPFKVHDNGSVYIDGTYPAYRAFAYTDSGNIAAFTEQGTTSFSNVSSGIAWSSHDLTKSSGEVAFEGDPVFYPAPLWEKVLKVVERETETGLPGMLGTMKILVACGVGLMALLVGLKLFGKRSLLFLKR